MAFGAVLGVGILKVCSAELSGEGDPFFRPTAWHRPRRVKRSDAEQTRTVQLSSVSHPPDGLAGPGGGWIITPTSSLSWKELRLLWSLACSVFKLFRTVMRGTMCFQVSFAVASNLCLDISETLSFFFCFVSRFG